jgi:Mce-associated membrane protein
VEVAVPPAHDQPAGLTEGPHDDPTRSTTFRLALAGVLALILVLSLGASVWLAASRGFEAVGIDRGAGELQAERDQVMSQTRQFMLRMGTYGPDQLEGAQLPEYRRLVTEVITPKFATSFDQSVTTAEQIVAKAGVSREAEVFSAGVSTIDADSATALVAGTFTDSTPTTPGSCSPRSRCRSGSRSRWSRPRASGWSTTSRP